MDKTEARKEKTKQYSKKQRENNPNYHKEYQEKHKEKYQKHRKNYWLLRRYGISLEEYNLKLEQQNHCCALCGIHKDDTNKKLLVVDHCHTTKAVRGLLCYQCNLGIGYFHEDVDKLLNAIHYLKRY